MAGAMSPKKLWDRKFALWLYPRISGTVYRQSAMSAKKFGDEDRKLALCHVPGFSPYVLSISNRRRPTQYLDRTERADVFTHTVYE